MMKSATCRGACMGELPHHHLGSDIGAELLWKVRLVKTLVCRTRSLSFLAIWSAYGVMVCTYIKFVPV